MDEKALLCDIFLEVLLVISINRKESVQ